MRSHLLASGAWKIETYRHPETDEKMVEYVCKPEGAKDALCRMPAIETEVRTSERSSRTKTRLVNLSDISISINRPESHLLAFLALHNNATAGADKYGTYFIGHFSPRLLQASVLMFLERYVVCGVTGSPVTLIATVIGRNGERKLRLKGPESEGNLSPKKCGHSYAGMLDVVANDPMPEAEQMAILYSEHCMLHPNPGIPPMRSMRAIQRSAEALDPNYAIAPRGDRTPHHVGLPADATQEQREMVHRAASEEEAIDYYENDSLLGDSDSDNEDPVDLLDPHHPHHARATAMLQASHAKRGAVKL